MNKDTNYSILIKSFTNLYDELITTDAEMLLTTHQVFTFVTEIIFQESKPKQEYLVEALRQTLEMYPREIRKLVRICLKRFAEGFSHQKGAIFGFGPGADKDTGTVMKIREEQIYFPQRRSRISKIQEASRRNRKSQGGMRK